MTLGSKTLNVTALGTADTGAIASTVGTTVNVTAGNALTVSGNVGIGTTTPGGAVALTTNANNGAINLNANVSTGSNTAGTVAVTADGTGSITGTGTMTTGTLTLASGSGSIGLVSSALNTQASNLSGNSLGSVYLQNTGAVSLNASTGANFSLTSSGNLATAGSVSASNGSLTLATTTGATVTASNALSATQNVNLLGASGVIVNNAVPINAGLIGSAYSASNTNYNSYNMTAFTSPGAITLATTNGDIQIGNNNTWTSLGGSIGAQTGATNSITVGSGNNFFAQGGNVYFNAGQNITISPGLTITAIGRAFPVSSLHPAITIAGQTIPDFQGGDVAVDAGTIQPNYNNYLHNTLDMARTANGTLYISGNVTTTGYHPSYTNGGTLNLVAPGTGSLDVSNSTLTANGAVINFDPNGVIGAANITIIASGPSLTPTPTPVNPHIPTPEPFTPVSPTTPSVAPEAGLLVTASGVKLTTAISPTITLASDDQETSNGDFASTTAIATDVTKRIKPPNAFNFNLSPCVPGVVMNRDDSKAGGYFMSDSNKRPFYLTDKRDSGFFATPGSMFRLKDDSTVELTTGRVVVMAGSKPISLQLQNGTVTISPEGTAVVEQNSKGVDRVANLAVEGVSVSTKGSAQPAQAKSGEEYVLADSSLNDEELIPVDDVPRSPIDGGKIVVSGKLIQKQNLDVNKLLSKEKWLYINTDCFSTPLKLRLEKIRKQLQLANGESASPILDRESSNNLQIQRNFGEPYNSPTHRLIGAVQINPFEKSSTKIAETAVAVRTESLPKVVLASAFLQATDLSKVSDRTEVVKPSLDIDARNLVRPMLESAGQMADKQKLAYAAGAVPIPANLLNPGKTVKMTADAYEVSHMGDALVRADDDANLSLTKGEILVHAKHALNLHLGSVNLSLKPETIVLINHGKSSVQIQVLWDKSDHSAKLISDKDEFNLSCGEEAIIGFEEISFVDAFAADHLARRRVEGIKLTDKVTGVHSEIDLDEILLNNRILLNLFKAEGNNSDLLKKLVKMAACLEEATAQHGDYERL
jgi:hypothetical protein